MAEAFRTNIVLRDDEARTFIDTMVVNTPEEMKITSEELAEMQQIAKKLGLPSEVFEKRIIK